ncbi:histidine kinase N-terminal 7TM domain-containing protein [Leptospira kobayashii]|nr:histidine kinase N-terminal 7TM domain-containing protein [Leptospira kobayashii]
MSWISIIPFFAFLIGGFNGMIAWRNRNIPGSLPFLGIITGIIIYSFGYLIELNCETVEQALFWDNIQFIGTDLLILFPPLLILSLVGKWNKQTKLILIPLIGFILINQCIVWFFPDLVRSNLKLINSELGVFFQYKWEIWMNINAGFALFVLLLSSVILLYFGFSTRGFFKRQILIVMIGLWLPFSTGVMTSFGLVPYINPQLDLSPLAFSVANIIWALGFYHIRFFDLIPLARDAIFENLKDTLLVTDDKWNILDANRAAFSLFESGFGSIIASSISSISPDLHNLLYTMKINNWKEGEWTKNFKGENRTFIVSTQDVFKQKSIYHTIILKDITESKLAFQRTEIIRKQKDELEEAINNLKKAQNQLILSEKMASLGNLVSGIAHEINNPIAAIQATNHIISESLESFPNTILNAIDSFRLLTEKDIQNLHILISRIPADLQNPVGNDFRIRRQQLSNELQKLGIKNPFDIAEDMIAVGIYEIPESCYYLLQETKFKPAVDFTLKCLSVYSGAKLIEFAVIRTSKIIYSLRNFIHSNPNATKTPIRISDSLETVITLYQNLWKRGIEIVRNFSYDPEIYGYYDDLLQLWTNLIQNALQAMNYRGKLTLTLKDETRDTKQYLGVEIEDTGPGIPDSIRDKIFEPFFTTKPLGEGTGLGLDIVQKITAKHKGILELETKPGRTVFRILLPLSS